MRWEWIHLVRMSNVMGNLELRRVGWDRLIALNSREVCELIISGEGAPEIMRMMSIHQLVENLDAA